MSNLYGMITVEGSTEYTELALKTFFRHTRLDAQDRFVLIDNDGYWSQQPRDLDPNWVHVNAQPKNTSGNINQLITWAQQERKDLIFLSNDVVFTPRWQERLIADDHVLSVPSCNQTHDYGFPSSMSIQDFGNKFGQLNVAAHQHAAKVRQPFEGLIMPTYVCRIPYRLHMAVGLFDESFNVGGEDVDYRLRLLSQGFSIKYCSSFLLHFNGRSSWNGVETPSQTQARDQLYKNNFIDKWGWDLFNLCVTGGDAVEIIQKYDLESLVANSQYNDAIVKVLTQNATTQRNIQ